MSIKQSIALRKRWKKISKEDRSKAMSVLAKQRHEKLSPEERKKNAFVMVRAKRALIKKIK